MTTPSNESAAIEKYQDEALSKLEFAGRMYEQINLAQLIERGQFKSLDELKTYLNIQSSKLDSILTLPSHAWVMSDFCLDIDATLAKCNVTSSQGKST
jgi:hypothetical protein